MEAAPLVGDFQEEEPLDPDSWWLQATGESLPEGLVAAVTQAMPVDRIEWHSAQLADPKCQDWEAKIDQGDDLHFQVRGGLLYRRTICPELDESQEPVVD